MYMYKLVSASFSHYNVMLIWLHLDNFFLSCRKLDITNETLPEDDCSRLLRSRPKDTFINPSDFLDVHFSPFVLSELHIMNRGVCIHILKLLLLIYVC